MTEPTTAAGRALAARAKREAWGNWEGTAQFVIPDIEAMARQPALDVLDNLLRHHNTLHHGPCEFASAALARLQEQDR